MKLKLKNGKTVNIELAKSYDGGVFITGEGEDNRTWYLLKFTNQGMIEKCNYIDTLPGLKLTKTRSRIKTAKE